MTNGKRRLMSLFLLGLCLVLIAGIGFQMVVGIGATRAGSASYSGITIIAPVESEVCVGGEVLFPVTVIVREDDLPNQAEIAEAWCQPGLEGGCIGVQPDNLREGAKRLPLLKPKRIERVTSRTVPLWLEPGDWEFWHTIQDKASVVEGYSVEPIVVKDCAP